jgi:hypothetical protein
MTLTFGTVVSCINHSMMAHLKKNDFDFKIGGKVFNKLWFLTNEIYPELSRFVKPISEPLDRWEALFSIWQEEKRKDVEWGFGVPKKKIGFLQAPFQMYHISDIDEIVYCCFILHNIAVEERIISSDDIPESACFYECVINDNNFPEEPAGAIAAMAHVQEKNDALADRQLKVQRLQQMGIDIYDATLTSRAVNVQALDLSTTLAHARWKELYNFTEYKCLQRAIIYELRNKYSYSE